jgi:hypothetical protein
LLFATAEPDFAIELTKLIRDYGLKGTVISYGIEKPYHAKSRLWNIASGREAIRQYMLKSTEARFLIYFDADMIFQTNVIDVLLQQLGQNDVIFSGAPLKQNGLGLSGCGCVLLKRESLENLRFRCYEFRNGEVIFEDNVLEMDLFAHKYKINKGFFLSIDHYFNSSEIAHVCPQKVGLLKSITNNNFLRYCFIKSSIILHYNFPWHIKKLFKN